MRARTADLITATERNYIILSGIYFGALSFYPALFLEVFL